MPWLIDAYYVEIEHAYQARAALAASDILVQYLILSSTIIIPFVSHCRLFIFAVTKCLYILPPRFLACLPTTLSTPLVLFHALRPGFYNIFYVLNSQMVVPKKLKLADLSVQSSGTQTFNGRAENLYL